MFFKNFPKIILLVAVIVFWGSGSFHLAKFETVDEHFWKYERIPQYWQAIKDHNLKKTYINDKPGVSVALISGAGLLFESNPKDHRIRDKELTRDDDLTLYDVSRTEKINFSLRFPLVLFNGLSLIFFFWVIKKMTDSEWLAAWTVLLFGMSPILIGISQIINPDALLWTFSAGAIFSYLALLKTGEKKFIILTAILTGLGLLSKYTAGILWALYFLAFILKYLITFSNFERKNVRQYFFRQIFYWAIIFAGSIVTFIAFLPAVFIKAKYLLRGTIDSPGLGEIFWPLIGAIAIFLLDNLFLKSFLSLRLGKFFAKRKQWFFRLLAFGLLIIFVLILLNCWFGQKWIPFDDLRDLIYQKKNSHFNSILPKDSVFLKTGKEILIQFYPFVFSQLSIALGILMIFWAKILWKGLEKFQFYGAFIMTVILLYFPALLFSNVLSNIRYSIMLYPLIMFLIILAIFELKQFFKKDSFKMNLLISLAIFLSCGWALWSIRPFFFNYTNLLLPKKFIITDSWGYGEYEAAEVLNSLPNAKELIIWSDRSAICQFIKGSCIRDYEIDISKTKPDYFVVTKRGVIRHQFQWKYPELANKKASEYYRDNLENNFFWATFIGGREENFVKIIKAEES